MSERVELMRQRIREEAAESAIARIKAARTSQTPCAPLPVVVGKAKVLGIDRTPCPKCGVRADIGCKHSKGR